LVVAAEGKHRLQGCEGAPAQRSLEARELGKGRPDLVAVDGNVAFRLLDHGLFGLGDEPCLQFPITPHPPGRYSPAICTGARRVEVEGAPDPKHISTSYVERQNLTMRMHMRRFTRLTNGFSKKLENHANAIALHFAYYNFVRIHQTLRMTPAMAAGVTDKLWEMADLVAIVEAADKPAARGPYKKRIA